MSDVYEGFYKFSLILASKIDNKDPSAAATQKYIDNIQAACEPYIFQKEKFSGFEYFMFLIIFLLLGVMVFLLWREWWQQLVYAKWSSPPTLQRETFSRFEFLMFLIRFEDHHHYHHHHHGLPSLEQMVMNLGLCKMTFVLTIHVKMEKQFVFYFLR